ncbi:flagellin-like hook-associated protein FlgL [Desulfitispora alkaliphila]|uniref:hypothetical protein n=1 Tax=Desulfitispora alkaliphila TaxID=622674 RepID=UPI003D1CF2D2
MPNEEYLKQKLEWVKYRLKVLDEIEAKLLEMRELAEQAKGEDLTDVERANLNRKVQLLEKEVNQLDDKSRTFWRDCN